MSFISDSWEAGLSCIRKALLGDIYAQIVDKDNKSCRAKAVIESRGAT